MSGITMSTDAVRVPTGNAAVTATIGHPSTEDAATPPALAVFCDPLPLAGDASHDLTDAVADALLEAGVSTATYRPACDDLILDDYDTYSAPQCLDELLSVWQTATSDQRIASATDSRRILIGFGVGAVIALAAANRIDCIDGLCLVNPASASDITGALARSSAAKHGRSALPRMFTSSIAELDTRPARAASPPRLQCCAGAADDIIDPTSALALTAAARAAGWPARALLIAGGDHAFTHPATRNLAVQQVLGMCAADRQS